MEGRAYLGFLFQRERVYPHHNGDAVIAIVGAGAPMGSSYLKNHKQVVREVELTMAKAAPDPLTSSLGHQ